MKQSFIRYILGILCFIFLLVPSSAFGWGNNAPIAADDSATTDKNTIVMIDVLANDDDPDHDDISLTKITVQASHGTATIKNGQVEYTPENNYIGSDSFEYEIKDDAFFSKTDTATVSITINDIVNVAPDAIDDSAETQENNVITIDVLANDTDENGDTLSVTGTSNGPSHGSVVINSDNTITYTPDSGYTGNDSFDYTISDGKGGSDTATVSITINASSSNTDPNANDDSASTNENTSVVIDVLSNDSDSDNDNLSVDSTSNGPSHGSVVINSDNTITYTPENGYTGNDSFEYTISDGNGGSDTATVSINIGSSSNDDAVSTADDLCYDWIDYSVDGFGMCIDFGIVKGGINCKQTISIRNQGNDDLSDVKVVINTTGFSGSFLSDCGIDGESKKGEACEEDNMFDMGPMGIFGSGVVYDPMPDYAPDDNHTIYDKAFVSMAIFQGENLYGYYTKNGVRYIGEIYECGKSGGDYQVGRIDGWDTFRDEDTPPDDINISTKIVNNPFKVSVGTFDKERTVYQTLPGTGNVEFGIYEDGTTNLISNTDSFNASEVSHVHESTEFKVTKSVKIARIGFKLCLVHEYDTKTGDEIYRLYPANDCADEDPVACNVRTKNNTPQWHICYSTDKFAIRPKEFSLITPSTFTDDEDIELMRSAKDYNFTVRALDNDNKSTLSYDQNKSKLDINTTKLTRAGEKDDSLAGTISFAENDFKFIDGNSTDDNGNHEVVGLSFNDVGLVNIHIIDKDWASIDSDDTPQSCEGGTINGKDIPYGTYICSDKNATFIPDHFELVDINITNRRKDANFTYISNDLNMSAHVELRIKAVNADGNITKNFRDGNITYYENPIEINISVPSTITFPDNSEKNMTIIDKNVSRNLLGFGGDDENGTHTITWNDSNTTQKLLFNYARTNNTPNNPFIINGSDTNISVNSIYTSSSGVEATIKGWGIAERNVTFVYARTKATKDIYDDVEESSITTPIKVEVYCDKWPASTQQCPGVDIINGQTNNYKWWLSTDHNTSNNDGNITLSISDNGSLNNSFINITKDGINQSVTVTHTSSTLPDIVNISLVDDTTSTTTTNTWLIYNPNDPIQTPAVLYKVRFIGNGTWTGVGETGHVVGNTGNNKKTQRMDW